MQRLSDVRVILMEVGRVKEAGGVQEAALNLRGWRRLGEEEI